MGDVNFKIIENNIGEYKEELAAACARALETVGIKAEGYAKLACPVDTGRLRNSITHQVSESEHAVYIGTDVEYAPYVELGTSRMKAQPYLRPAVENHLDEYKQIVQNELSKG